MTVGRGTIGRSLDIYYRDTVRTKRMDALNAQFIVQGGLAFDIGAHVGDRTASFLRLGASVVAVEPQPRVFRALRLIHGRNRAATLYQVAVGAAPGETAMHLNSSNPTVSTLSNALVAAAPTSSGWSSQVWDRQINVPITTLDLLIHRHGRPDFIKIDVEGFELDVLRGLSIPVRALSFEVTTLQRDVAFGCLDRLAAIGPYRFNLSLGEEHALRHRDWLTAPQMTAELAALPDAANSGDVFARLQ